MSSNFLEDELAEAKSEILKFEGCTIVTCVAAQVRVGYKKTDHKNLNIIIQFTAGYHDEPVVLELTSETLSEKRLAGLIKMCDEEAKKLLGKKQASGACFRLLMTSANTLYPDQAQQDTGPDLVSKLFDARILLLHTKKKTEEKNVIPKMLRTTIEQAVAIKS